jgi:septal ring factor EnvC (AmiA/AmiB activator)
MDVSMKAKNDIDILKKAVKNYKEENEFLRDNINNLESDLADLTEEFNDIMNERDQLEMDLQHLEDR